MDIYQWIVLSVVHMIVGFGVVAVATIKCGYDPEDTHGYPPPLLVAALWPVAALWVGSVLSRRLMAKLKPRDWNGES